MSQEVLTPSTTSPDATQRRVTINLPIRSTEILAFLSQQRKLKFSGRVSYGSLVAEALDLLARRNGSSPAPRLARRNGSSPSPRKRPRSAKR
jgi:hypothetical protein